MRAARIYAYGHSDQIRLEDAPRPAIGPGDVLVKVRAAGVNPVDWKIREGYFRDSMAVSFPFTLGQDFSGDVTECGPDVGGFKRGDSVFGFASGAYAEFVSVRAGALAQKPRSIDYQMAASIPTPGLTAYQLIIDIIRAAKDQSILIHGAAGGVGAFAVQLARWKGARVMATASSEDLPELKQLGAYEVIDYKSERFEDRVKGVDAVVDLVGGETLARSYSVVKPGGIVVSIVGPPDQHQLQLKQIRGQFYRMQRDADDLKKLADLIHRGTLKVRVKQAFPLMLAKEAQDLSQGGRSHGKIVLLTD
ncbi:MAG TPA: NADP-dependent oxidoreductase [Planctomycetota bacterium]|nr:NADP-dependent oxidoreductase [Planctomycetota bacterium]